MHEIGANTPSCQLSEESPSSEPRSPEASPGSRTQDLVSPSAQKEFRKREPRKVCRKDVGTLHRVKHGILSREALEALVQMGEDRRTFRRLERNIE